MKIIKSLLIMALTLISPLVLASSTSHKEIFIFKTKDKKTIQIDLISYQNHLDAKEVKIQASALRK